MLRNLKITSSIAVGILLVTSGPSWAGRNAYVPVVVKVPAFVLPSFSSEKLELSGLAESTPYGQTIDLNSRVSPARNQYSPVKFQVSGKNCSVRDGFLRANEPTVCRVIAARLSSPFSPMTVSEATFYKFGSEQAPLNLMIDTTGTLENMKGQSVALKTTGGSGIGVVRFDAQPGDACLPNSATTSNNTNPVCSILANEVGSVCSVVGNLLTATAATVCRVTAVKEGDPLYLPVSSDQVFIKFGAGIGDQPIIVSPPKPPAPPTPISTLVISNDPTSSAAGVPITLTTVGGKGSGAVTYTEVNGSAACVIVGNQLFRATFGTCRVRATKAADALNASQNSQIVVFTFYGSRVQEPLVINTTISISRIGIPINLSTTGGSSEGVVSYAITSSTGVGTITGSVLSATTAGTFTVVATKQGDTQFASVVSDPVTFTFTV